jgi:hypothetical protein
MIAIPVIAALFFLAMGLVALVVPERIAATFGTPALTVDGRNEVRAVYGGFGVAIGVLLLAAERLPAIRQGALVAVAVALAGMAGGRLVAAALERPRTFYPAWFYCAVETVGAVALLIAAGS